MKILYARVTVNIKEPYNISISRIYKVKDTCEGYMKKGYLIGTVLINDFFKENKITNLKEQKRIRKNIDIQVNKILP